MAPASSSPVRKKRKGASPTVAPSSSMLTNIRQNSDENLKTNLFFAVVYAVAIALFLLAVGFRWDTLPYPRGGEYSDTANTHWPNAIYFQDAIRAGYFPQWRDLFMVAQPFAMDPLSKAVYPPQWLAVFLTPSLHVNVMLWMHLVLAAITMRLLALRLKMSSMTPAILGLAYALTPRLLAAGGAGHMDILYAASWFPALLWAVHCLVSSPFNRRNLSQQIAVVSLITAMVILADIQICLFELAFAAVFGAWLVNFNPTTKLDPVRKKTIVFAATICLLLVATLTAIQWIPVQQLSAYLSHRGLTQAEAGVQALEPVRLITLIVPDVGGSQETMIYVGGAIFLLALVAVLHAPRQHIFWLLTVIFTAWYALGMNSGLWTMLTTIAPPLLWMRVPPRIWYVGALALIILTGYGIDIIKEGVFLRRTSTRIGLLLIIAALTISAAMISTNFITALLVIIDMGGTGMIILTHHMLSRRLHKALLVLIVIVDLTGMGVTLIEGRSRTEWLDPYAPIAHALQQAQVARVYSPDYSFPQQAAAYWHISTFGGVDPIHIRSIVESFEAATGAHSSGYTVTLPPFEGLDLKKANQNAVIDANKLARWNVSHVLSSFPITNPDLKLVSRPIELYLYENTRRPVGYSVQWNGPNRFTAINKSEIPVNVTAWVPAWNVIGNTTFNSLNSSIANGSTYPVVPQGGAGKLLSASYDTLGLNTGIALSLGSLFITLSLLLNLSQQSGELHDS
jgi:hypothetical protein